MDDKLEVYNNGHGWRIAFKFQGVMRVLTIEEAQELKRRLETGINRAILERDFEED